MRVLLHVEQADGTRERIEWPADRAITKIGRHPSSHVPLRGPDAARIRAVMERSGSEIFVIDLLSTAGTRVNGRHQRKAKIIDGDVMTFGECTVRVEIPGWRPGRIGPPSPMDQPPRVGRCPRCEQPLSLRRAEPEGYRDMPMRYLRCDRCELPGFVEDYDRRFGRAPASPHDAHRPLLSDEPLDDIFQLQEERKVSCNRTLHYKRVMYVLDPTPEAHGVEGKRVRVYEDDDGNVSIRSGPTELAARSFLEDARAGATPGDIVGNEHLGAVQSSR